MKEPFESFNPFLEFRFEEALFLGLEFEPDAMPSWWKIPAGEEWWEEWWEE